MGKLHRTNAGYLGVSMEETQDPFWTYNKLALPLSQGEPLASSTGALPIYNTTDAFGATKGSGVRSDAFASSIVLAIPMDGTNGGTSFSDESANIKGSGSAKSISVSSTTTSTTQAKHYGSSGSFDGTNSILTIANDADFNFGTGDFTVECWIYPTSLSGNGRMIMSQGGTAFNDQTGWSLLLSSTGTITLFVNGSSSKYVSVTNAISVNGWNHIAACKDSNGFRIYINGGLGVTDTTNVGSISSSSPFYIGRSQGSGGEYWSRYSGYLSDVRIYKGVAKYTSDFIVPESGPSTFDRSPSRKAVGNAGATWQTSVSKFYGGATLYDGNADYQQTPYNADFNFGSGDFTIESFIRLSALGTSKIIANYIAPTATTGNDLGWIFDVNSSNQLEGVLYSGTSAVGLIQAGSLTTGTWYHVAYVRSGSTFLIFLDGSQIGSATGTAAHNVNTGWNVSIGYGHTSGTQYMNGYIQDLRIYKGIAKYTSSFTPPVRSLVQTARRYPSGMHVLS